MPDTSSGFYDLRLLRLLFLKHSHSLQQSLELSYFDPVYDKYLEQKNVPYLDHTRFFPLSMLVHDLPNNLEFCFDHSATISHMVYSQSRYFHLHK